MNNPNDFFNNLEEPQNEEPQNVFFKDQNYEEEPEQPKNKINSKIIMLAIASIVIIVSLIFGIIRLTTNSSKVEITPVEITQKEDPTTNNNTTSEENTSTTSESTTTEDESNINKVTYSGYTFRIPKEYKYQEYENYLFISDTDQTWASAISIQDGEYSVVENKKSDLKDKYTKAGYEVNNVYPKEISSKRMIVLELNKSNQKGLAAITKASNSQIFVITVYNNQNIYDFNTLEKIINILIKTTNESV